MGQFDVEAALQAAEKRPETVILSEAKNLALCIFRKTPRVRSFAALRMTNLGRFSAACLSRHLAR